MKANERRSSSHRAIVMHSIRTALSLSPNIMQRSLPPVRNYNPQSRSKGRMSPDNYREQASCSTEEVDITRYILLQTVGTGSFSRVRLAVDRISGAVVAIKVMSKSVIVKLKQVVHVLNEKRVLSKLMNPFCIRLHESFQDQYSLYLVLEFANGGELYHLLQAQGSLNPHLVRMYAAEMICALSFLHARKIVYRDIKPENILLTAAGHLKLVDFGFAKVLDSSERTYTLCGTPEYLAPEVINHKGYGFPCDWWGLGILIYEMLVGHAPFRNQDPRKLYEKILTESVMYPETVDEVTVSLLSVLLEKDPTCRATESQIKAHPYFSTLDWRDVKDLKLEPLYIPRTANAFDTKNFDTYPETDLPIDQQQLTDLGLFRDF